MADASRVAARSALERRAEFWIAPYFNAEHLLRTRDYVVALDPRAGDALRIAALTHDIERHFPGGPRVDIGSPPDDPVYVRRHCERSARFVDEWLTGEHASDALRRQVVELVLAHEEGGTPAANLLQAADSLSFLEVNGELPRRWIDEARASPEQGRAKLDATLERIRLPAARALALPMYRSAVSGLHERATRRNG